MIKFDIAYNCYIEFITKKGCDCIVNKEEIYVWLCMLNIEYLTYIKLMNVFKSSIKLYNSDKKQIENILKSNNFFIDSNLKSNIEDPQYKEKARIIYNKLKQNNVNIIPINSKEYPSKLNKIFSPPICLFVRGNIKCLSSNIVYVYKEKNSSYENRKIQKWIYDRYSNYNNILFFKKDINIKIINLANEYEKIITDDENFNIANIYVNNPNNNYVKNIEVAAGIIDKFIIIEAKYKKETVLLVDCILEYGKEILVFPNSILSTNSYFSNYLIKNGASIITSFKDIEDNIKNGTFLFSTK